MARAQAERGKSPASSLPRDTPAPITPSTAAGMAANDRRDSQRRGGVCSPKSAISVTDRSRGGAASTPCAEVLSNTDLSTTSGITNSPRSSKSNVPKSGVCREFGYASTRRCRYIPSSDPVVTRMPDRPRSCVSPSMRHPVNSECPCTGPLSRARWSSSADVMIRRLRRAFSVDSGVSCHGPVSRHLMAGPSAIPLWHASRITKMCFAGSSEIARSQASSSIHVATLCDASAGIR